MRTHHLCTLLALIVISFATSLSRSRANDEIFARDVAPIFAQHCNECHGVDTQEAQLNLSTDKLVLYGSASGPILAPGAADASLLLKLVTSGSKPHMPPDGQLDHKQIEKLRIWIDSLSADALPPRIASAKSHWAYQPLATPAPPEVNNEAWSRGAVDNFVLAKLESLELAQAPEASAAELCRRVYFDLLGLPPTPEQQQDFAADCASDPQGYERLVDKLLASPAYGERWGRHWLDLARYADSSGFHEDIDRPYAWRYRDYVIQSFNEDKEYGQFVREQIAGDILAPSDPQSWIATGFCRNGPSNDDNMGEGLAKEKYRLDLLDDVIATTSAVIVGQTIGCARCHDHKYDPIAQTDYYRMLAVFDNTERVNMTLQDGAVERLTATKKSDAKDKASKAPIYGIMALTERKEKPRVTRVLWRGNVANPGPEVEPAMPVALPPDGFHWDKSAQTNTRAELARWLTSHDNALTWRVIANRIWQHHFGKGIVSTPSNFGLAGARPTHPELLDWLARRLLQNGGSIKPLHREIVLSTTYRQSARNPQAHARDPENQWLARRSPMRIEAEILRDTILSVCGTLNLQVGGPGIKPRIRSELLVASQRNKWPVVTKENSQHWRRSVYIYVKRQLPFPLLELFDAPTSTQTCECRQQSVVPTQALVLMNDEFTQEQATFFAQRLLTRSELSQDAGTQKPTHSESIVNEAVKLALGRDATASEQQEGSAFWAEQKQMHVQAGCEAEEAETRALADFCHVLVNSNEFAYIP